MGRIERQINLPSISIDRKFIEELFSIVKKSNRKNDSLIIEISVFFDGENTTYTNLEDFFMDRTMPQEIKRFTIKIDPKHKSDRTKTLRLYFRINEEGKNSYYNLLGYDNGALLDLENKIKNLIEEYTNWYSFMRAGTQVFSWGAAIGVGYLLYNILSIFNLSPDWQNGLAILIGLISIGQFEKVRKFFFPFFNININKTKRKTFWMNFAGAISLGLLVNGLYILIKFIISKVV